MGAIANQLTVVLALALFAANQSFKLNVGRQAFSRQAFQLRESDTKFTGGSSQIARLKADAAKLRAEAAILEAANKNEQLGKLAGVFKAFDTNNDGSISLEELKEGLQTQLSKEISSASVLEIMKAFDTSGDGSIQLEEFPARGIETFQNKLRDIMDAERAQSALLQKEAAVAKAEADQLQSIVEVINNQPPTTSDKVISLGFYLLPLLDAIPYGKQLIVNWNPEPNPLLDALGLVYSIYELVPFSGLIAFFLFNVLSNNLKLNRLVRFNIQQAIFIDIALIFPGIIGAVLDILSQQLTGAAIPVALQNQGASATFLVVSVAIFYSMLSSLLGEIPDKLPFISERVKSRVPTTEQFKDMLKQGMDQQKEQAQKMEEMEKAKRGKSIPKDTREKEEEKDKESKKEKDESAKGE